MKQNGILFNKSDIYVTSVDIIYNIHHGIDHIQSICDNSVHTDNEFTNHD